MAWSEAAYLSKKDAVVTSSSLIAAVVNTARQNIIAAQSIIPDDGTVLRHSSPLETLSIYSLQADKRTWSSWGGNA